MRAVFRYLKAGAWAAVCVCFALIFAQVWLDLKLPEYMAEITTLVQTPGSVMRDVWLAGGKMLVCTLASVATSVAVGFISARVAAAFSRDLRGGLFEHVENFTMEEIGGFSTASLITRTTNDITQVQMLVAMGLQIVIRAPIMAVWAMLKISAKQWEWTALVGAAIGAMVLLIVFMMIYALPKFRKIQTLTDNLNRVTRENLTGIRVVRAYNADLYEQAKFGAANHELTDNNLKVFSAMAVFMPFISIVINAMSLGIYWIGARLIDAAPMASKIPLFADMITFSQYSMQVLMSFMMLVMIFVMLPRVMVSVRRIAEVLNTEPRIRDGNVTESPAGISGEVVFENVSFKYPGAEDYVLRDVTFSAKRGETVAIIGSTGSGKSSLLNLVPRFYDTTEGSVYVDGVNVRDYTQEALRNKLGYIPQRAILFKGTVTDNVKFGYSASEHTDVEGDVKKAVSIAQGTEFVEEMPEGYEASISQGGTNVSGGQKQRLAIARAIYRNPEIFIFDDTFSALDYTTDRALRSALKRETGGVTRLIVAQRIGTIRDADKILVLDGGRLAGTGTHSELMQNCEVYREIAFSQLSEEELA
ncbi:MAG: ABC transporter ATP-binding protein/permease [Oscillospiraceae bacterium]|jgi:ATP-binding cassette subfamily B protein|nr:ABC transporter ATP-binding protein/permease [Oscillospiraceae bacterium]